MINHLHIILGFVVIGFTVLLGSAESPTPSRRPNIPELHIKGSVDPPVSNPSTLMKRKL